MGKFTAFFLSFIVIPLGSLWAATQRIAEIMEYNAHFLGKPFIGHYYLPWRYFQWKALYGPIVPKIFSSVSIYFPVAFFLSMALLYFTSHTKDMTSHGSARWAEYRDLLKLDLISGSGVVVGLYDSPLKRAFTSFLRSVELVKKEKKAFAELSFERRKALQMDKNVQKIARLKEEIADSDDPKRKESLQKKIGMLEAENNRKYDPLDELDFFVWFLDLSYKILFGLYKKMSHFYLRDNSNKHLAVIAPTRSGKGVGLIVPTLLGGWTESCIINDIKSENWGITAGFRKKMGQKVIKFEPTADHTGFEFQNTVVGGNVPKEYIPGVEKGLRTAMDTGVIAGYPVTGVKATLYDGAYHEVDSNVMCFEIAARAAFREGMKQANPKLLEPIMKVEVVTPEEYMGDIIGDLNSRRGLVNGMDQRGNARVVDAFVPLANMFGYVNTLRSLSQGRAQFTMIFDRYSEVPREVAETIKAKTA